MKPCSAQQKAEGTVIIHRTVESDDVEDYSTHIPGDVVNVTKKEDLTYTSGHLTYARGVSKVKMLPQVLYTCSNIQQMAHYGIFRN